ncbi:P12 family lipoprotein (plasmid) [Borreliella sinica]|uniref:P12 family lipoprotein n=1 Tax=Borreliella sinica TaxID=87162 RepID=UPI002A24DE45|nr:P12 family lipoprotein [Borreliella sinica]WPM06359.1 P12 family lipoprotein [Borreliella sinica]
MKKNILATCMLMLINLLSCRINDPNESIGQAQKALVGKGKLLGFMEKAQEDVKFFGKSINIKEKENQLTEAVSEESVISVKPINIESLMVLNSPNYPQEEIIIKEEDLVPSTNEEKGAEKVINDIKNILEDSKFDELVNDGIKLENKYGELESNFYKVYGELKNEIGPSFYDFYSERSSKFFERIKANPVIKNKLKEYYYPKENRNKRNKINQLINQLNSKRTDLEELRSKLDIGLGERTSAKYFFEQAQETLKKSITERLKNKNISSRSRRKRDGDLVAIARQAQREVDNALKQLEDSSSKIDEVMERMKEIEKLVQEARVALK